MIKVEVIEKFTLEDYKKLKNVEKVQKRKDNEFGIKDTFECDKEMAEYLTGKNDFNKTVVKVIEVKPEKEIEDGTLEHFYKTIMPQPIKEEKPKISKKKKSIKK